MNDCSYDTDESVGFFSALADGTRLRILDALGDGPVCVCDLVETCEVSQSGVSHQLRVLREAGLVTFERRGRHSYYSLADDAVRTLIADAHAHARRAQESIGRGHNR